MARKPQNSYNDAAMVKKVKRIYVDSTVVLGHFDISETRRQETDVFWDAVQNGEVVVIASDVLDDEIKSEHARDFLVSLPESNVVWIDTTTESTALAKLYISEKVIGESSLNDCHHVALATVFADGIVSWNMKDMVNRHKKYNNVNKAHGYPEIKIVTPDNFKEIHNEH